MASKRTHNGKVRLVLMRPVAIEFEFSGDEKLLNDVSRHMIETKYPERVESGGEAGEFYTAKLMEATISPSDPEPSLEEMIAPGIP